MAQAQGFDLSLNFAESNTGESDRRILENLVETGITGDLILFANNLRDFSEMPSEAYVVDSGTGLITINADGYLPFSDGTKLFITTYTSSDDKSNLIGASLSSVEYEVFESNALNTFKIKDGNGNVVTTGFDGALNGLRRKDIVTFLNLRLLKETRIPAVDEALEGEANQSEGDISLFDDFDISGVYTAVDNSIASLEFAKTGVPRTYEPSIFNNKNLVFEGNVRILNTQDIAVNDPGNASVAPGLYIKAGENNKRAFSDTSNPWSKTSGDADVGDALETEADNATVGALHILGSPALKGTWSTSAATVSPAGPITDWSHKIPVKINNGSTTVFMLVKT